MDVGKGKNIYLEMCTVPYTNQFGIKYNFLIFAIDWLLYLIIITNDINN